MLIIWAARYSKKVIFFTDYDCDINQDLYFHSQTVLSYI